MAATWIKPIHNYSGKTEAEIIKDTLDYVQNPEKTQDGVMVASYQCNVLTADLEFADAKHDYFLNTGRKPQGDILFYHVRQSFKPGEITPEAAQEMGRLLAMELTGGNHAFVIATHDDKPHLHNHIIINAINLDCNGKYRNKLKSFRHLERISNKICAEHGYSVIESPAFGTGKYRPKEERQPTHRDILVTNAFKYTEHGTVELSLKCEREQDGYVTLVISVQDTGIGMTQMQIEELEDLNSEYVRLHEQEKPFVSGTGRGLPIVYSLVQMMNAQFKLTSEINKGTNINVRIPQKISGTEILGAELARSLQNFEASTWSAAKTLTFTPESMPYGKVLVVDDVDSNLYVAEAMLESFDLTIELCESGQDAIDKIRQGKVYDIIFLDHMMPGIDGIETAKILRGMEYNHPIVALTANALKGQVELFMSNGFSGFMSKPIDINRLNSYLVRFIKDKHAEQA
jgi:CheY-like chemotaxis protein